MYEYVEALWTFVIPTLRRFYLHSGGYNCGNLRFIVFLSCSADWIWMRKLELPRPHLQRNKRRLYKNVFPVRRSPTPNQPTFPIIKLALTFSTYYRDSILQRFNCRPVMDRIKHLYNQIKSNQILYYCAPKSWPESRPTLSAAHRNN